MYHKIILLVELIIYLMAVKGENVTTIRVEIGGHCALGAAPVGPGGSWQIVEHNVEKKCPTGTSCRKGACNCDDLSDGTITSISLNSVGERTCKRIAGQKCVSNDQCFEGVPCDCETSKCVCKCPTNDSSFNCVNTKVDVVILA